MIKKLLQKKFIKIILIVGLILILLPVAFFGTAIISGIFTDSSSVTHQDNKVETEVKTENKEPEEEIKEEPKEEVKEEVKTESINNEVEAETETKTESVENKSSETETISPSKSMDLLMEKAKEKEKDIYIYDDKDSIKNIFNYIVLAVNSNTVFESKEKMENIMYYGRVLELYSKRLLEKNEQVEYMKELNKFGSDSVQMVKYVYRGAETPEDQATLSNIEQVKKSSNKLKSFINSL